MCNYVFWAGVAPTGRSGAVFPLVSEEVVLEWHLGRGGAGARVGAGARGGAISRLVSEEVVLEWHLLAESSRSSC